ncbi:MAG: hypothetical protein JWQ11_453 [Rhizobacter sp.]|nr:hypothetical protein [Rhizobacter sp.]
MDGSREPRSSRSVVSTVRLSVTRPTLFVLAGCPFEPENRIEASGNWEAVTGIGSGNFRWIGS